MSAICRVLEWDSQFFERRIGTVTHQRLSADVMPDMLAWAAQEQIDCLYFLADADCATTSELAAAYGFQMQDIRVTYERALAATANVSPQLPQGVQARFAQPEDLAALQAIAETSHTDTRFFFDRRFPRAAVTALYRTWISKSCMGYADAVLVLERDGQAQGYISCHLQGERRGQIGLVGVDARARGQGLGQSLVRAALAWFAAQGAASVSVVTQGRNIAAQRLYQRAGFVTQSLHIWYHKWFEQACSGQNS